MQSSVGLKGFYKPNRWVLSITSCLGDNVAKGAKYAEDHSNQKGEAGDSLRDGCRIPSHVALLKIFALYRK